MYIVQVKIQSQTFFRSYFPVAAIIGEQEKYQKDIRKTFTLGYTYNTFNMD